MLENGKFYLKFHTKVNTSHACV